MVGIAGASPSNGDQVGTATPKAPFTATTPFSSGQVINVTVPVNSVFNNPNVNLVIEECADPGGVLPTQSSACDANTVDGDTINPATDGSVTYSNYTVYALPDTTSLGESPSRTPACNLTNECVLYIGTNVQDFTQPHFWSQGFFVAPTTNDTGANPGDGSAPSAAATPSASVSTVTASPPTAVADGVDKSTVTVTINGLNSSNATVPIPNAPVILTQGSSSHSVIETSPAIADGSGVATFTVTDPTNETVAYTASSGAVTVTENAQVVFAPPAVSPSNSTVVASVANPPADGTTSSTITVTVRDQASSPQPISGVAVILGQGTASSVITPSSTAMTNGSGIATFTVTDTTTQPVSYTATAGGVQITQMAQVTFGSLVVSPGDSTVVVASPTAPSGAGGGTQVTVTLKTAGGASPVAGKNVVLTATGSAVVSPSGPELTVTNGGAVFNVTDTSVETVTVTATDQDDSLTIGHQSIQFVAATTSPTLSTVSFVSSDPPSLSNPADGTSPFNVIVTIKSTAGTPVAGDVVSVAPATTDHKVAVTPDTPAGSSVPGSTDSTGAAEFQVLDTVAESVMFTVIDTTTSVTLTPTPPLMLTFTAGPADGFQSELAASPPSVAADGSTASTVDVKMLDHFGNAVAGRTVTLDQGSGHSKISPATAVTGTNGVAAFSVTDSTNEIVTYTGVDVTDGNLAVSQTIDVTFGTPPPVIPVTNDSIIVSNFSSIPADGKTAATISVLLYDANGLPVPGRTVALKSSGGSSSISPATKASDQNGAATFIVTSTSPQKVTYTGVDTTDNVPVSGSVTLIFTTPASGSKGLNAAIVGIAATQDGGGYWMAAADGGVFSFGDAHFYGSAGGLRLNKPIVGMAPTPDGGGYWLVASDGGIFRFGDAVFYGSAGGLRLNKPIVGMSVTPDGKGYWLVASDGGVFRYGDAKFFGSTGSLHLNQPVVGMATAPYGQGYWLVAADGGIFAFGDANFTGSAGALHLNKPIVGMAAGPNGDGYWLVASDGGIFTYGMATFHGSAGALHLTQAVVGMAPTPSGDGYWLVAADGGVFSGNAHFYGSAA